jgi:hypothetical protein
VLAERGHYSLNMDADIMLLWCLLLLLSFPPPGAIPVILGDDYAFPYSELIDWRSFAVILPESSWETMMDVLHSFTIEEIARMRRNMGIAYNKFFKNDITLVC